MMISTVVITYLNVYDRYIYIYISTISVYVVPGKVQIVAANLKKNLKI